MQVSTVVTRTPAGSAELAAPAHGLSLAQRRFLTLLDSACPIEVLAARQPGDAEKLQRDLARLASLGLVAFDSPAANDAHVALDTVRLGPPGASSRLPYILVALVAAALGLVAWHFFASSPPSAHRANAPHPSPTPVDTAPPKTDAHAATPPVHVASAMPAAAALAPTPPRKLVPIAQEPPSFPREATAAGLASGSVKARLTIDAKGNVSSVEIVEASHRAFDRTVRDALSRWRFEPGTTGRTTTVDVAFRRD